MNKRQQYQKEYYNKHKEYLKAYNKLNYHLLYKDRKKEQEEQYYLKYPEKALLRSAKQSAKNKNLEINIELSDIVIPKLCPVLQIPFNFDRRSGRRLDGPSIDRIDSTKGYIKGNIQIISDLANRMKQNATIEQLKLFGEWTKTL